MDKKAFILNQLASHFCHLKILLELKDLSKHCFVKVSLYSYLNHGIDGNL